jgi:hypothetical protein
MDNEQLDALETRMQRMRGWIGVNPKTVIELIHQVRKLTSEREEAIAALRSMCADYGDNEWPETLHLADIIETHLRPTVDYIDSLARNR